MIFSVYIVDREVQAEPMTIQAAHCWARRANYRPDVPIIDAHHHLFDRPTLRYLFDDYLATSVSGHRIIAAVYIETRPMAHPTAPRYLGRWARSSCERRRCDGRKCNYGDAGLRGHRGHADLRFGQAIGEYLDSALDRAPDRLQWRRQVSPR